MIVDPLGDVEAAIGHAFLDRSLLRAALIHRSYCAEHPEERPNERLEFLGDAILSLSVTDHVFTTYPALPEGELAKVRAWVVSADVLADVAVSVGLGPALVLGKGEAESGGREKRSVLADAMEAVIAAVYLDAGWEAARTLVLGLFGPLIEHGATGPGDDDFKSRLQELTLRQSEVLPRYQVRDEGPDHSKRFFAMVTVAGAVRGHGEGRSKKAAEQAAARSAWEALAQDAGTP